LRISMILTEASGRGKVPTSLTRIVIWCNVLGLGSMSGRNVGTSRQRLKPRTLRGTQPTPIPPILRCRPLRRQQWTMARNIDCRNKMRTKWKRRKKTTPAAWRTSHCFTVPPTAELLM